MAQIWPVPAENSTQRFSTRCNIGQNTEAFCGQVSSPQTDLPGTSRAQTPGAPLNHANTTGTTRSGSPTVRDLARLGAGLVVKGEISCDEDLLIHGTVEGGITLQSHRLTVGSTAQLSSNVVAREVVIHGEVCGILRVRDGLVRLGIRAGPN